MPAEYRRVRFTAEQQARLNKVLAGYEGTHNFHNYTVRVPAGDPAAMRYILSFKCAGTMEIQARAHLSSFKPRSCMSNSQNAVLPAPWGCLRPWGLSAP